MAFPFFDSRNGGKREQTLAVDLGGRTTKAVHVRHRGKDFVLGGYAVLDAPIFEKTISAELLREHLKAVVQAIAAKAKYVTLTVGVSDALIRHADMPRMPIDDLRRVLKLSAKTYLQQDLSGYVFDCHIGAPGQQPKAADKAKQAAGPPKQRVLVAGARKQFLDDYVEGSRGAGLTVGCIVPGLIGPVNAFEQAMPDVFANEAVALVDLGFRNSSICILQQGELILSRVVGIGGDRLTSGLAEALNVSYAEAEGIKVGMPTEVQAQLESLVLPLGRELRASIDFFEHQQDRPVTQAFITGGAARSEFFVQTLQREMMIGCKILNPTTFLQMELPQQQTVELEQVAPQLTVALGAALAAL
jgi:type IV pilus assembly protein PilM